ncbi:MAG: hypothetical protein ACYYK0_03770 [Candidatus Eutrophobiaceae bacterium]
MTLGIIGLTACYILLALLLLSINLYSRLSWQIKATSIVLTSAFYLVSWFSFPPLLGWPTKANPPEQFRVLSVHVTQANKELNEEGAIYFWIQGLENMESVLPPRAHKFPYTDELHQEAVTIKAKMEKGVDQLGEFKEPEENALELQDDTRTTQISDNLEFYDMPDPLFPEK